MCLAWRSCHSLMGSLAFIVSYDRARWLFKQLSSTATGIMCAKLKSIGLGANGDTKSTDLQLACIRQARNVMFSVTMSSTLLHTILLIHFSMDGTSAQL